MKSLANNGRFGGEFVRRSSPHTVTRISCPQAAQWKMSMWVSSRAGMARDAASRIGLPQRHAGDSIRSDEAIGFHLLLAPWGRIGRAIISALLQRTTGALVRVFNPGVIMPPRP